MWLPGEIWNIIFEFVLDGSDEYALDNFRFTMKNFNFDGIKVPYSEYSDILVTGNRIPVKYSFYSIIEWQYENYPYRIDLNHVTRIALMSKLQRKDANLWFPLELVHPKVIPIILDRMDWRLVHKFLDSSLGWKHNRLSGMQTRTQALIDYATKICVKNKIILPKTRRSYIKYDFFSYENKPMLQKI